VIDLSTERDKPRPRPDIVVKQLGRSVARGLSIANVGSLYVLAAMVVVFWIIAPDAFARGSTVSQVLNTSAVTALVSLGLLVPLAAGVFDLAVGYTMTLSGVVAAYFDARTGTGLVAALLLALLVALAIGVVNGFVVVVLRIDSFIATLGMSSILGALAILVTGDQSIADSSLAGSFSKLGQTVIFSGITLPVLYMVVVAVAMWWLFEHTATGRRLYATGYNEPAARLAGVPTRRIRFAALVTSSFFAGIAGVVLASIISSGDPSAGVSYLLSAFAACFFGATQLKRGRFNSWGTILAIIVLSTGSVGLGLSNAPQWAPDMLDGIVLLGALILSRFEREATRN
jgi:ribose transport system permease protein